MNENFELKNKFWKLFQRLESKILNLLRSTKISRHFPAFRRLIPIFCF